MRFGAKYTPEVSKLQNDACVDPENKPFLSPHHSMANFNQLPEDVPWLEISIFILSIGLVLIVFNYIILNDSNEQPVTFDVPIPEQCAPQWKGEVLDRPSIKVFASHHSISLQKDSY